MSCVRTLSELLLVELLVVEAVLELTALVEEVLLVLVVEFSAAASLFSSSEAVETAEMDTEPPFLTLRM
jgi:hypothetical protein